MPARYCTNCEGSGVDDRDRPCRCTDSDPPPTKVKTCRLCLGTERRGDGYCTCLMIRGLSLFIGRLPPSPTRSEKESRLTELRTLHAQRVIAMLRT